LLDRLAGSREGVAQSQLDPIGARDAEFLELQLQQGEGGCPRLHIIERGLRDSRPGNDRPERLALVRADAVKNWQQAGTDAEPGEFGGEGRGILLVDDRLDNQGAGVICRLVELRRSPLGARREQMDGAEQINIRVAVGDFPQRRLRLFGIGGR
jgi:hypothetical protein